MRSAPGPRAAVANWPFTGRVVESLGHLCTFDFCDCSSASLLALGVSHLVVSPHLRALQFPHISLSRLTGCRSIRCSPTGVGLFSRNTPQSLMTAFGDLFLRDDEGRVHFLDLMAGEFKPVADSQDEFDRL